MASGAGIRRQGAVKAKVDVKGKATVRIQVNNKPPVPLPDPDDAEPSKAQPDDPKHPSSDSIDNNPNDKMVKRPAYGMGCFYAIRLY